MIEEIGAALYRVEVPLPRNPLRSINAYLIKGDGRHLLIDTGLHHPECLAVLQGALKTLGAAPEETDVFLTPMHADHIGLVGQLAGRSSRGMRPSRPSSVERSRIPTRFRSGTPTYRNP